MNIYKKHRELPSSKWGKGFPPKSSVKTHCGRFTKKNSHTRSQMDWILDMIYNQSLVQNPEEPAGCRMIDTWRHPWDRSTCLKTRANFYSYACHPFVGQTRNLPSTSLSISYLSLRSILHPKFIVKSRGVSQPKHKLPQLSGVWYSILVENGSPITGHNNHDHGNWQ